MSADNNRVVFLNVVYRRFLDDLHRQHPGLTSLSERDQTRIVLDSCFGNSDFYSRALAEHGWETTNIIANVVPMSQESLLRSILDFDADVVYFNDMILGTESLLSELGRRGILAVGQIACTLVPSIHIDGFDAIVTSHPPYEQLFTDMGVHTMYQPLAFDPRMAEYCVPYESRLYPVSHVGGMSSVHVDRMRYLAALVGTCPMMVWGYVDDVGPGMSEATGLLKEIAPAYSGSCWGRDMFRVLGNSRIVFNRHGVIDDERIPYSNNSRMYEVTGMGALLITDRSKNIGDLFADDEVVLYDSKESAIDAVRYYTEHVEEAESIASRGQARTMACHTFNRRMEAVSDMLHSMLEVSE